MSEDIDPFESPPLVEYENCVTLPEFRIIFNDLWTMYQRTSKWRLIERYKYRVAASIVESIYEWVLKGKPINDQSQVN
jgi:hypothetical protein